MKSLEPKSDILKHVKTKSPLPYAKELGEAAQTIADSTTVAVEAGKMGGVEAAGHISMAMLLGGISTGDIPLKQAYPLLKGIAEKKTPDPVVKIEARQEIDMRAIIVDAVSQNPTALQDVVAISIAAREQVRIKIGAEDNRLELKPVQKTVLPASAEQEPAEVSTDGGLDEFSYDLRKMEFEEMMQKGKTGQLEQMLNNEAAGVVYQEAKTNDKDWAPGSEPAEIRKLRERDEQQDGSRTA